MRFDLHLRTRVREQIATLAEKMRSWEELPRVQERERSKILEAIGFFPHTRQVSSLIVAGVDGSGDFPTVNYLDSFVYLAVAQGVIYQADPICGLKEVSPVPQPVVRFTWLPEDREVRLREYSEAFADLASIPVSNVIRESDYHALKARESGKSSTLEELENNFLLPHAADSGNIGIQLRTTAELSAAIGLIRSGVGIRFLLLDGTLSLPLVTRRDASLFYEHLKRLCCVEARTRGMGLFFLSKSHGLPTVEVLEEIARERLGLEQGKTAEHWYLRVPFAEDGWSLTLSEGVKLPPSGAVTYLVRFHKSTPIMRLDMDRNYWHERVQGENEGKTRQNEQQIFADLDYTCHDQRCYGYPYPIKAAHDRASLTEAERISLRKQVIDAAVTTGMKRSLFRDVSLATGHK